MLWPFELKNVVSPAPTLKGKPLIIFTAPLHADASISIWNKIPALLVGAKRCVWTCDCMCVSLCVFLSKHYLCVRRNWHKFNMQIILSSRFERQMWRWRVWWAFFFFLYWNVMLFWTLTLGIIYSFHLISIEIVSTQYLCIWFPEISSNTKSTVNSSAITSPTQTCFQTELQPPPYSPPKHNHTKCPPLNVLCSAI